MATPLKQREAAGIRNWANGFPYMNGGLFGPYPAPHPLAPSPKAGEGGQEAVSPLSQGGRGAGGEGQENIAVPRFSRIARSYLLHVGNLDWTKINPDIFGLMIQAVADDEERGALGMHYTSVPNILKVLNPLFLDDLRAQLEETDDNPRKLLNLRKRMARIRVFDPACGSRNFLVIAYEMRAIEAEINRRRGEPDLKSEIPLTNFRGIEIRHFSCEIARLALIIAEYQCDVLYRGPQLALAEFLPLKADKWITCGNAVHFGCSRTRQTDGVYLIYQAGFRKPCRGGFAHQPCRTCTSSGPGGGGIANSTQQRNPNLFETYTQITPDQFFRGKRSC